MCAKLIGRQAPGGRQAASARASGCAQNSIHCAGQTRLPPASWTPAKCARHSIILLNRAGVREALWLRRRQRRRSCLCGKVCAPNTLCAHFESSGCTRGALVCERVRLLAKLFWRGINSLSSRVGDSFLSPQPAAWPDVARLATCHEMDGRALYHPERPKETEFLPARGQRSMRSCVCVFALWSWRAGSIFIDRSLCFCAPCSALLCQAAL